MRELIGDGFYYYDIPYRALLPIRLENVIAAGRNISCDVVGQSGVRLLMLCLTLGEVAGTAAALSIEHNVKYREVNVKELQKVLVNNGVDIGEKFRQIPGLN